ncbi:hypothetical protein ACFCXR_20155 [Streptomyces noursei]|uniref:hypothetical protein n=1 Tax=Streptomyces noursei TaxID=1971 RepID=UPI0035DD3798
MPQLDDLGLGDREAVVDGRGRARGPTRRAVATAGRLDAAWGSRHGERSGAGPVTVCGETRPTRPRSGGERRDADVVTVQAPAPHAWQTHPG